MLLGAIDQREKQQDGGKNPRKSVYLHRSWKTPGPFPSKFCCARCRGTSWPPRCELVDAPLREAVLPENLSARQAEVLKEELTQRTADPAYRRADGAERNCRRRAETRRRRAHLHQCHRGDWSDARCSQTLFGHAEHGAHGAGQAQADAPRMAARPCQPPQSAPQPNSAAGPDAGSAQAAASRAAHAGHKPGRPRLSPLAAGRRGGQCKTGKPKAAATSALLTPAIATKDDKKGSAQTNSAAALAMPVPPAADQPATGATVKNAALACRCHGKRARKLPHPRPRRARPRRKPPPL